MKLKLPQLLTWKSTFTRWGAELRAANFIDNRDVKFSDYNLTVQGTGSMTVALREVYFAKYLSLGEAVIVMGRFMMDTSGVAENTIRVNAPPQFKDKVFQGTFDRGIAILSNGAAAQSGVPFILNVGKEVDGSFRLTPYDGGNWALTTDTVVRFGAIYLRN